MVSRALALALAICCVAFATAEGAESRRLVHPYLPTGPIEVAGAPAANKTLRAVQHYTMPAFTDVLATHVANTLQTLSDEPVVVVRKSRQGGKEAVDEVAKAPADGRTLLLATDAPTLRGVARVAVMPYVIVVRSDSRYSDVGELIKHFRASSERLLAASAGEKNVSHMALLMLRSRYELRAEPIAYGGGYAALQALVRKEVGVALVPLPSVMPYASGGRLKILPAAEPAHVDVSDAFHVFAPVGTPNIVIAQLNTLIDEHLVTPDAQALFTSLGVRLEHRSAGVRPR